MSIFKKFKPKYYAKVPLGKGKFRYFYTKDEYLAYMNKDKKVIEEPKPKKTSIFDKLKNSINKIVDKVLETGNEIVEKLTSPLPKKVDKAIENGKKAVEKAMNGIEDTYMKDIRKKAETVSNVITAATSGLIGLAVSKVVDTIKDATTDDVSDFIEDSESPKSLDDLKLKTTETSKEQDQAAINEWYETSEWEATNNCAYCTAAYDLRRRGYDVEAMPQHGIGEYNTTILSWYENPEPYSVSWDSYRYNPSVVKEMTEILAEYGDGARGHFLVSWNGGGGHSVVWEVEGNDVVIRDCQTNKTMDLSDIMPYAYEATFFRSDNLDFNEKILEAVRNTNPDW